MKRYLVLIMAVFTLLYTDSAGVMRREELSKKELRNGLLCLKGEEGPYTGVLVSYYEDNSIKSLMSYTEGLLDGARVLYYRSGLIKSKENYVAGVKEGVTFLYYEDGQVMVKTDYQNGKKNGEKVLYHKNGEIKRVTSYRNGKKQEVLSLEGNIVKESEGDTL